MRFVSPIKNINVFISAQLSPRGAIADDVLELVASLNLLGKAAWIRLDSEHVRFTVVPDQGTQVWAYADPHPHRQWTDAHPA